MYYLHKSFPKEQILKQDHHKWPLYAIIACFGIPIVLAHLLYYFNYAKNHTATLGTLITPPLFLSSPKQKTWKIAFLASKESNPLHLKALENRHQNLGKDQHRVRLISLNPPSTKGHKTWKPTALSRKDYQSLRQLKNENKPCHYFIIDPHSQVVLCYQRGIEPKYLDKDLRKLLKNSHIG